MTVQVPVRIGNWGRHARRALDLLHRGYVVELLEHDAVVGYLTPPRLPITVPIIEQVVRRSPPEQAAEVRRMLQDMAASGIWSYEPHTGMCVTAPPYLRSHPPVARRTLMSRYERTAKGRAGVSA